MIDTNSLHIGSHVLFNGERVEVTEISCGEVVGVVTANESDWHEVMSDRLDPIPITEELLAELGFEKEFDEGLDIWYKGIENPNTLLGHTLIRVLKLSNRWEVQEPPRYATPVSYLHELQQFIYLTTKQRLL